MTVRDAASNCGESVNSLSRAAFARLAGICTPGRHLHAWPAFAPLACI